MYKSIKLKDISKTIGSGITPLRCNPMFWEKGTIYWLKTEQLGEHKIFETTEKITQYAVDNTSVKIFPKNTLSIAMYGEGRTRGNVSILKSEMTTNQACCNIVIDSKKADFEYVYYFLKTQYHNLRSLSSGVRKNLNSNDIKEFEVRMPNNISTQQKIAKVLSDLDAKIELNNKINTELEAMAKTLYDYWFVQFDFPDANGKPYKSSGGKMVYNGELKREIPEGWEVYSLSSLVNCNKWTIKKDDIFSEINYLDTSSLTHNIIDKVQQINPGIDKVPSRAQRVISQNDILYSTVRPNQCHFGIIKEPVSNMIASTGFAQLRSKKDFISNDIIYTFLSSNTVTTRLQQIADTSVSAYPSISHNDILGLKVVLPQNNEILKKINNLLDNIYTKTSMNLKENQELSSLRDWLLPMLMNGQVSVGDVEEELGMVAEGRESYGK
jgi:type I restriction enzyme S subunit